MGRAREFLEEHLRTILVALIVIIAIVLATVVFSVIAGDTGDRVLFVSEVAGGVSVIKGDGQIAASRNMSISSGDTVVTDSEGIVKLKTDSGKYIYVEPSSTVYVNYTQQKERGTIAVNISDGSVVCRLDNKLKKDAAFEVRTPNSIISAQGTVFHVDFTYHEEYNGYNNVMVTQVRSVESDLTLQLYNINGERSGEPQTLGEGLSAELMSCTGFNGYNCLNEEYSLTEFTPSTLRNLIRIRGERSIPYELTDLNSAFNAVYGRIEESTGELIVAPPVTSEDSYYSSAPFGMLPEDSGTDREIVTSVPVLSDTDTVSTSAELPVSEGMMTVSDIPVSTESTTASASQSAVTTTPAPAVTTTVSPVTAAPHTTTAVPVTTAPPVTTTRTTTTAAPATVYVPPVTTAPPAVTTAERTTTAVTETETVTESEETTVSLNWWEIINSNNTSREEETDPENES